MRSSKPPPTSVLIEQLADLAASTAATSSGSIPPLAAAPRREIEEDQPSARIGHAGRALLRRTLVACSIEGIFAEIVAACAGGAVLTGWGLHLGCSPFVISLLSAMPFIGQLAHVPASWLVATRSARTIAVVSVLASRLCYLALAVIPFVSATVSTQRAMLVLTALVSGLLAVAGNNAWQVWMADVVPQAIRGRYFGRRIAICTAASGIASISAGLVIDHAAASAHTAEALAALALAASIGGIVAAVFMSRQHEGTRTRDLVRAPELEPRLLRRTLVPLSDPAARAFMAYQAAWNAANGLTAGFFAVYMLEELKTGFVGLAMHALGMGAARMFAAPVWGRLVDRVGPRIVLTAATIGIAFLPALWVLATPTFVAPIVLDAAIGGALLSGQALAGFALPLSLASRRERPFYVAAIALAGGPCFTASAMVAGAFVSALPSRIASGDHRISSLHVLFVLAVFARLLVVALAFEVLVPARTAFEAIARALRSWRVP